MQSTLYGWQPRNGLPYEVVDAEHNTYPTTITSRSRSKNTKVSTMVPPSTMRKWKQRSAKRPGYIPRPPNSFVFFRCDFVRRNTGTGGDLSRRAGMAWKHLPEEAKEQYRRRAAAAAAEHRNLYPDYVYQPEPRGTSSASRSQHSSPILRSHHCRPTAECHLCDNVSVSDGQRSTLTPASHDDDQYLDTSSVPSLAAAVSQQSEATNTNGLSMSPQPTREVIPMGQTMTKFSEQQSSPLLPAPLEGMTSRIMPYFTDTLSVGLHSPMNGPTDSLQIHHPIPEPTEQNQPHLGSPTSSRSIVPICMLPDMKTEQGASFSSLEVEGPASSSSSPASTMSVSDSESVSGSPSLYTPPLSYACVNVFGEHDLAEGVFGEFPTMLSSLGSCFGARGARGEAVGGLINGEDPFWAGQQLSNLAKSSVTSSGSLVENTDWTMGGRQWDACFEIPIPQPCEAQAYDLGCGVQEGFDGYFAQQQAGDAIVGGDLEVCSLVGPDKSSMAGHVANPAANDFPWYLNAIS